jgi:D-alanyl-D-alanine carboxypeptidase
MMRAELVHKEKKSHIKIYLFGVLFLIAGIGFGVLSLPEHELLDAKVSDSDTASASSSSSRIAAIHQQDTLSHVVPFLKTTASDWKPQSGSAQQGVGGGPGLLKDALEAKATLSVDFNTGEVYYGFNSDRRMPMASTTKIMTAMTAMDLASLDEKFTVEEPATQVEPTVIGLKTGEKLTLRELIKGALLTSGNDAAAVIADGVGKKYNGDTSLFVRAMNEKAAFLGLKNTHFTNPQGYDDPQHYTTCEDLAVIARYALTHYPELQRIVMEKDDTIAANEFHHSFTLPNWNMLIDTYPGADGVKIGNTGDAGHTTVATATRNGKRVMAVVLGTSGILKRDLAAAELLNVGFQKLGITPFTMSDDILRTRIKDWYQ